MLLGSAAIFFNDLGIQVVTIPGEERIRALLAGEIDAAVVFASALAATDFDGGIFTFGPTGGAFAVGAEVLFATRSLWEGKLMMTRCRESKLLFSMPRTCPKRSLTAVTGKRFKRSRSAGLEMFTLRAFEPISLNRFRLHSPPLAAFVARGSEPDVLLTQVGEWLTSPNTPPLEGGDPLF